MKNKHAEILNTIIKREAAFYSSFGFSNLFYFFDSESTNSAWLILLIAKQLLTGGNTDGNTCYHSEQVVTQTFWSTYDRAAELWAREGMLRKVLRRVVSLPDFDRKPKCDLRVISRSKAKSVCPCVVGRTKISVRKTCLNQILTAGSSSHLFSPQL